MSRREIAVAGVLLVVTILLASRRWRFRNAARDVVAPLRSDGDASSFTRRFDTMKYCPFCGAAEQVGAKFCPTCGKRYGSRPGGFNPRDILDWRPLETVVERVTKFMTPASEACASYLRRGLDMLLTENYKAPSFLIWNVIALFCCSFFCGAIGTFYSIRVLQLQRNHDSSAPAASRYAKLWLFLAVVVFCLVRLPIMLRMRG